MKRRLDKNVLEASRERIATAFDKFERIYISYSGGKDSTVMTHLVMDEAKRRGKKVGLLIIDLEAQYQLTDLHMRQLVSTYAEHVELFWVCLPMSLRNATSNYDPRWICWEPEKPWVREMPECAIREEYYFPFFRHGMEFEEFMVEFGRWYSQGKPTGAFVGIRADESLNRYRTIASASKETFEGLRWTTKVDDNLFNLYPIYDWKTQDIWTFHARHPELSFNKIYEYMFRAGVPFSQMRLCQPYGDDQRRGLWLFHVLEPHTWTKVVNRVSGANAGALYVQETGNVCGYNKITLPENHSWESYARLLMGSLPKATQEHYLKRFRVFIKWWKRRGYVEGLPNEAPAVLENKGLAPSWKRICKVLLRNDYWCKGLHFSQPKSEAWKRFVASRTGKGRRKKTVAETLFGKEEPAS